MTQSQLTYVWRGLFQALFRQRLAFWSVPVLALAAAAAASLLLQPVWRSEAKVTLPPATADRVGPDLPSSRETRRLAAARLLGQGLFAGMTPDAVAELLGAGLSVDSLDAESFQLAYETPDRAVAPPVLQAVIDAWGARIADIQGKAATVLLDQQAAAYRGALEEAQRQLAAARQGHRGPSGEDERRRLLRQKADLEAELRKVTVAFNDAQNRMAAVQNQITTVISQNPFQDQAARYKVVDETKSRLLELQLKEQDLRAKYTDSSQLLTTVREEIRRVQAFLDEMQATMNARNNTPSPVELQADHARLQQAALTAQNRRAAIESQMTEIDRQLADSGAHEGELRQLEQEVAAHQADLRRVQQERDAQLAAARQVTLGLVQAPSRPLRPERPDPPLYFGLAVGLGLPGGFLLALLAEALSRSFGAPRDVERRLGLPVLAALPRKS